MFGRKKTGLTTEVIRPVDFILPLAATDKPSRKTDYASVFSAAAAAGAGAGSAGGVGAAPSVP
jgi:hypothetical protein